MSEKKRVPQLRFKEFTECWKKKTFKKLLIDYRLGGNYSNSDKVTDKPLIKMGNLGRGNIVLNKLQYIDDAEIVEEIDIIKEGDLFFNTRNTLELVGKVAVWKNELPLAYYNSNLMKIEFDNNYFMNYRLNSPEGIKGLKRFATGTTSVAAIYTKDLLKLELFIPSIQEQQKTASFLLSIDKKIALLQKKKTLLEHYKKGVMQQIFSQKIRFKDADGNEFPNWEEKRLGKIGTFFSGGTPKSTNKNYDAGTIPFIGSGSISDYSVQQFGTLEAIESSSAKMVEIGDLLYALYGATSGEVAISKIKGVINQAVLCIRTDENKSFLFQLLKYRKSNITSKLHQGGQGNLSANILKKLKINLPSIKEQTKIANFLSAIDDKIQLVAESIEATQQFKKGLLQQMFV